MAGDWIKMRCNLWDDPRVARLCDLTDSSEATIIGAMFWLWAAADQHSEDGIMPGLSLKSIDRKTGVNGFGSAMVEIGWLADHPEGIRIVRFDEHNGASAKKRCQTAKRVAIFKAGNAEVTHGALPDDNKCVSDALPREREEKEKSQQPFSEQAMGGLGGAGGETATDPSASRTAKPARRVCSIPDDFTPNEAGIAYASQRRISLHDELPAFCNWHQAKGSTMKDWQAAWRTWCDKAVEFGRAGVTANGARASPQFDARSQDRKRAIAEMTGKTHEPREREINPALRLAAAGVG